MRRDLGKRLKLHAAKKQVLSTLSWRWARVLAVWTTRRVCQSTGRIACWPFSFQGVLQRRLSPLWLVWGFHPRWRGISRRSRYGVEPSPQGVCWRPCFLSLLFLSWDRPIGLWTRWMWTLEGRGSEYSPLIPLLQCQHTWPSYLPTQYGRPLVANKFIAPSGSKLPRPPRLPGDSRRLMRRDGKN